MYSTVSVDREPDKVPEEEKVEEEKVEEKVEEEKVEEKVEEEKVEEEKVEVVKVGEEKVEEADKVMDLPSKEIVKIEKDNDLDETSTLVNFFEDIKQIAEDKGIDVKVNTDSFTLFDDASEV